MQRQGGVLGATASAVGQRVPGAAELEAWPVLPCPQPPLGRDVALDLLRGLAMLILVVNHTQLPSWLSVGTSAVLSAAEVLVPVSGVAVGMVFGRRWQRDGGRIVTAQLLARARKLYVASVVLVAAVGLATLVPGLDTDAIAQTRDGRDLYAADGIAGTVLSVLTLGAGPWQFCILGFFVASLVAAPALLWALDRGAWWALLGGSALAYVAGRAAGGIDVLPTQSEGPFPILIWQALFVPGMIVGFHRRRIAATLARARGLFGLAVAAVALAAAALQVGLAPDTALRWQAAHFDKATLDPARVLVMLSIALGVYLLMRRHTRRAERTLGWVLLPLGRNSFYVFIVHVPLCLVLANVPGLTGAGVGMAGNSLILIACVGALVLLVRHEVLFRWIPR